MFDSEVFLNVNYNYIYTSISKGNSVLISSHCTTPLNNNIVISSKLKIEHLTHTYRGVCTLIYTHIYNVGLNKF